MLNEIYAVFRSLYILPSVQIRACCSRSFRLSCARLNNSVLYISLGMVCVWLWFVWFSVTGNGRELYVVIARVLLYREFSFLFSPPSSCPPFLMMSAGYVQI